MSEHLPKVHLITVGTSLLLNANQDDDCEDLHKRLTNKDAVKSPVESDILSLCSRFMRNRCSRLPLDQVFDQDPTPDGRILYDAGYKKLKTYNVESELKKRYQPGSQSKDCLPAELSYLYLHYRYLDWQQNHDAVPCPTEPTDVLYLLASYSWSGIYCACCIKRYIEDDSDGGSRDARNYLRKFIKRVILDYVPGLQALV